MKNLRLVNKAIYAEKKLSDSDLGSIVQANKNSVSYHCYMTLLQFTTRRARIKHTQHTETWSNLIQTLMQT